MGGSYCGVVRSREFICKYVPNYYKEQQEVGEIGGSFSGTVEPIVPLPMVSLLWPSCGC